VEVHGHPRRNEAASIVEIFVEEEVQAASRNIGGRQVRQVVGAAWREPASPFIVEFISPLERRPREFVGGARPDELARYRIGERG
jgi:hypothetical protein